MISSSNEDIIRLIKDGSHDEIGAEKLRGLLKILPEVDELEMLKSFDGDKSKLGNAEKFFLQLIQVPKWVSSTYFLIICITIDGGKIEIEIKLAWCALPVTNYA